MDQLSMAGELAWLIKDNLPCKHLILSAEETFIEFLGPSSSSEDVLEFEPMVSYHRMLLHRLADIFCLAHESVGEGDDRHLIVERCQDSSIPAVLVSDVLEWQYGETQSQQATCQLLKRKIALPDLQQKQLANQSPSISFEEREAAYLAARERIFSLSSSEENDEQREQETPRPRTVPVVAQRMIAHALGKRIIVDATCEKQEVPKNIEASQVYEKTPDKCFNGVPSQVQAQVAVKTTSEESTAAAAKRMINKYLNGDVSCINDKINAKVDTKVASTDMKTLHRNSSDSPQVVFSDPHFAKDGSECPPVIEAKRTPIKSLNSKILCMDDKMTDKNLNTDIPYIDEKLPDKGQTDTSEPASGAQQPGKTSLGHMPAAAAKRMFAQALGLPLVNVSFKTTMESTTRLGNGSNNTSDTQNVQTDTSYQNAQQFSVGVEQERNSSLPSKVRPEELHHSRDEVEPPSTSESLRTNPQKHLPAGRMQNMHVAGRAAQRLFAQALGIHSVSSTCIEGNQSRNSSATSPAFRGLPVGHKPAVSFEPSSAVQNSLASNPGMTIVPNDDCQGYDSNANNFFSRAGDVNGESNLEAMVLVDLYPSEPCETIDPERHTSGPSPKQLGDERGFARSVSLKGRKNIQDKTYNTTPKTSGRASRTNNSGPVKTKKSNYRIANTCSVDETSMISL